MLKILPQLFYETPDIQKILVDGLSCMIYKKLNEPVFQKEGYVSTHAITIILEGMLRVEGEDGSFIEIPKNKMVFLPKGIYTISDIIPTSSHFEAIVFFFEEQIISDFINSLQTAAQVKCSKEKCISHLILDYTENIKIFTESLRALYENNMKPPRELTKMKLFELLHIINDTQIGICFTMALATLNNKERKGLKTFMDENYSKPLLIEDYAYLTGRSISSFRRDFKAIFGISPKQWLINKRLEKAHELLLLNKNKSLNDVALETGYENIPHFIKAFHKKYHITPKQLSISNRKEVLI